MPARELVDGIGEVGFGVETVQLRRPRSVSLRDHVESDESVVIH